MRRSLVFTLMLIFASLFVFVFWGAPAAPTAVADPLPPVMNIHYSHDWVEGGYETGHTVTITVKESDNTTVKGTAVLTTAPIPWWNDDPGFSTNVDGWQGEQPDIQPGDWVHAQVDSDPSVAVQIGAITGNVSSVNDNIVGTVDASWLVQDTAVPVDCEPWGAPPNTPGKSSAAFPDGSDTYTCSWDPNSEWDVQPQQDITVFYSDPDGHRIGDIFHEPAPELEVEKWHAGNYAAPGSVVVYGIRIVNHGDLTAENVELTDPLPTYTSYVADTSGVVPTTGAGNLLTWDFGALDPGEEITFALTLEVASGAPQGDETIPENCATISTTTPGDTNPDNNQSCAGTVGVHSDDVQLRVDKWPQPNDPTPGEEFSYFVTWCNERGAAVGPVTLIDSLPSGITLLEWRPGDRENFWVAQPGGPQEIVLQATGLPGDWCETLELRLLLDGNASIGAALENTVSISAVGDVNPDDNEFVDTSVHVSPPRFDVRIEKSVHEYVPVPDGWINYFIHYYNDGNKPAAVSVTETVPPGLTFEEAAWGGSQPQENDPFPDAAVNGSQLTWDLGTAPVGYDAWFHIQMSVNGDVTPGTDIENCIAIDSGESDGSPDNNTSCITVTINDNGPNLQVEKYHWWNGDGQIEYRARFANIGDERVNTVQVKDTLPVDTGWAGWWHTEDFNFDEGRLTGEAQNGNILTWDFDYLDPGERGVLAFAADLDNPGTPLIEYTNVVEITPLTGDVNPDDNTYNDVAFSGGEVHWVEIDVGGTHIWGYAPQGPIVIDTATEQHTIPDGGDFDLNINTPFQPGDNLTITAGNGDHPVVITIPTPFTARANSHTEEVWGQVDHLDQEWIDVDLYGGSHINTQTDNSGNYSATFPDIPRGANGEVRYGTEIDYASVTFHRGFRTQDLIFQTHYGHDYVDGRYEVGHTVWITVTDSGGTVKGLAELTTAAFPFWNGDSGFSTNEDGWLTDPPDIQPGDWIYGRIDNDETTEVQIGTISGDVDSDDDSIQGTIAAPWLDENTPVLVECNTHGAPPDAPDPQNKQTDVLPDGSDIYECSWNPITEWDVQPGQDISVFYDDPSLNKVGNVFRDPAPYLRIQKWANGAPAEGGNMVLTIEYQNSGDAPAPDVTISDVMNGMSYLGDTSEVTPTGTGTAVDPLVWNLGAIDPGDWVGFDVFVAVTETAPNTIENTATIDTSSPHDQGAPEEKEATWQGDVIANETYLSVDKWAWTGDPAPDTDIVFTINVCNHGETHSNEITLTDTLHPLLALQSWEAQNEGWQEISVAGTDLALTIASFPAHTCYEVYLRAHVAAAAEPGEYVENLAVIASTSDLDTDNNEAHWGGNVNEPHTNLSIDKRFGWGQLVPLGHIGYNIYLHNNGNVPVGALQITDTLPEGTSFVEAYAHEPNGTSPFPPSQINTDTVVWSLPGLDNGDSLNFTVVVAIAADVLPGSELDNQVEVTLFPNEDNPNDNSANWVETVQDYGPNLRVRKEGDWQNGDPNSKYAHYWISVENIGSTRVENVSITDTYPAEMVMEPDVDTEWQRLDNWHDNPGQLEFTAQFQWLDPGETTWFNFNTSIPGPDPLPFDQTYSNSVTVAAVPGETNTLDNVDTAVLHSCLTPAAVTDLVIWVDGNDIVFDWSDVGADYYEIWWSTSNAYVDAGPQCNPDVEDCQFTDTNNHHRLVDAAGSPDAHFYRLMARMHCGAATQTQQTTGFFPFAIQPGG